jgi:UDP-2,3-diacylglucosamine pyrophosphatase LpxH
VSVQIWTATIDQRLKILRNEGLSQKQTAVKLSKEFGYNFTRNAVKNREKAMKEPPKNKNVEYKETVEILSDGSHKSDKLLTMSSEQAKDVEYLLKAHGFDTNAWDLLSAKNNIWNAYSKQDGVQTLYSSKITVKPKVQGTYYEKILEAIREIKPVHIDVQPININNNRLLEIPIFDPHFPISTYAYYQPTQAKIMDLLSRNWKEVLFVIGQDMLHNDNFRGQTANGTQIEHVDIPNAWEEARKFFEPMIEKAIKHSQKVKIVYSKGNHDESMSWAFVQMLKVRFPQAQFDDTIVERKVHVFEKVFIGITHGDKARKNLHNIFPVEFPNEWSQAKTREIHIGHYHVEDAKDVYGMVIRTLATRNKTDQWHKDNGFIGAHKRFMLFEYTQEELVSIHYV